ncbi:hypothetical protein DNTS_002898, partial [Danionella cerebrum]
CLGSTLREVLTSRPVMSLHGSSRSLGSSGLGPSGRTLKNGLGHSLSFNGQSSFGAWILRHLSTSSTANDDMPSFSEKQTLQNLNDRLASYLERVHSLEEANNELELQIRDFYQKKSRLQRTDFSTYFETVAELCAQIHTHALENTKISLKLDNARLAAEDFRIKSVSPTMYETKLSMCKPREKESARLREVLRELKLSIGNLENQFIGLKEELLYLKEKHEEDLNLLQVQQSSVKVEMDCVVNSKLEEDLLELRAHYEAVIEKKRREAERWFESKAVGLQAQMNSSSDEIKTSQTKLSDLKRTFQDLEIVLQGSRAMKENFEKSLPEVGMHYAAQLSQLQLSIDHLEYEQQRLGGSIREQGSEYQLLLDVKMRLEMEIADYRRLLDGQFERTSSKTSASETAVNKTEETKEEKKYNRHIQRRVKVIVEELVDGEVVSSSVEENVEEIS